MRVAPFTSSSPATTLGSDPHSGTGKKVLSSFFEPTKEYSLVNLPHIERCLTLWPKAHGSRQCGWPTCTTRATKHYQQQQQQVQMRRRRSTRISRGMCASRQGEQKRVGYCAKASERGRATVRMSATSDQERQCHGFCAQPTRSHVPITPFCFFVSFVSTGGYCSSISKHRCGRQMRTSLKSHSHLSSVRCFLHASTQYMY